MKKKIPIILAIILLIVIGLTEFTDKPFFK